MLRCRELSLPGDSRVASAGTFRKAKANPGSIPTKASLEKARKRLDKRIAASYRQLDEADADPEDGADGGEDPDLAAKLEALVEKQKHQPALQVRLQVKRGRQVAEGDPAAGRMRKPGKLVGDDHGQLAGADTHELIVAASVVQDGHACGQGAPLRTTACAAPGHAA